MKLAKHLLVYYCFQREQPADYNLYKYCEPFEQPTDVQLSPSQVKIIHIIRGFPFEAMSGRYHFRFKSEFKEQNENVVAWIDILNLESKVPLYNGAVYVKVLEVTGSARNKLFSEDKLAKTVANLNRPQQPKSVVRNQPSPAAPVADNRNKSASPQPNMNDGRKEKSPALQRPVVQQTDLIFEEVAKPSNPPAVAAKPQPPSASQGISNIDLMFPGAPVSSDSQSSRPIEMTTAQKLEQFKESTRLEELQKQNDMKARLELDESIDVTLSVAQKWAYTAKVRNNFRTLLVTVHELWPFGNWTQVQLSDLLTDKDLKKYHNKAQLIFHPDKNRDVDYKRRYLSKRISSELSEAFKKL